MDILEFAFWFAVIAFFAVGVIWRLADIMIKAARKERAWKKESILYGKTKRK